MYIQQTEKLYLLEVLIYIGIYTTVKLLSRLYILDNGSDNSYDGLTLWSLTFTRSTIRIYAFRL